MPEESLNEHDEKDAWSENGAAVDAALDKCAQELKALALIYQAYDRPRWAKEAYTAFLKMVEGGENNE